MKIESYRQQFVATVMRRIGLGVQDVATMARDNLGSGSGRLSGSVRVVQLGPGRWRIGSQHPGAMTQERGAFMRPRRGKALKFAGRYSAHARIPAKRWLSRAGRQTRSAFMRRLRGG